MTTPEMIMITSSPGPDLEPVELEAEFVPGSRDIGVVITHPHPLHGGSMHTPVPSCLFEQASALDLPALRFNFRGVGKSTGTHDKGVAERDDVRAATDALMEQSTATRVIIAGWSFGADVGLAVETDDIIGWFAVAAPLSVVPIDQMAAAHSTGPKMLAVPEHDQFMAPAAAAAATEGWVNTTLSTVAGGDHFLAGRLGVVGELFAAFASDLS